MPDVFSTIEDVDSNVVLDYTSRDFTAIRAQLVGLARGLMPEWETVGEASDFGTLLIELFAYMGDVMNFYIDRTASEAFLGTAIRRQSVLYIADMLGYTPIGQQSAIVKLFFALDANAPASVVIPAGTRVHNESGNANELIVFETNTEITLAPGGTDIVAYATEGLMHYNVLIGASQGTPNTEFIIPDSGVVYNTVAILSREGPSVIEWAFISDLSLARPTQSVFTTFIDDAEYTHILFGDNASGRIPPVNAEIFVTYRTGVGVEANSLAIGDLNVLVVDSTTPDEMWGVSVSNPEQPVGGTDPETIDAMRNSIPRAAARLKNRAITLNDYADLALQVPGVAKSMAHGTVYTTVHVRIAPIQGNANTESMTLLCQNVERYMQDKIIIGSSVRVEPTDVNDLWYLLSIRIMVHVQDSYNRTTVRTTVEAAIRQMLNFDNVDFGTMISIGSIYRMALAVQGVEWIDLFWLDDAAPVRGSIAYVTNRVLNANVVTLTFASHTFVVGQQVRVQIGDPVFDGYVTITVTSPTTIQYARTNANVGTAAATGTVTPASINVWVDDDQRVINDIITDDLHIPKIDPTSVTESTGDFPGLSGDELIHDGLWVQATGGLLGT